MDATASVILEWIWRGVTFGLVVIVIPIVRSIVTRINARFVSLENTATKVATDATCAVNGIQTAIIEQGKAMQQIANELRLESKDLEKRTALLEQRAIIRDSQCSAHLDAITEIGREARHTHTAVVALCAKQGVSLPVRDEEKP